MFQNDSILIALNEKRGRVHWKMKRQPPVAYLSAQAFWGEGDFRIE
jgi:hypothetical protein